MPSRERRLRRLAQGGPLAKGRPRSEIPVDAEQRIRALAAQPYTFTGVAMKMQTNTKTLRRWLTENEHLQDAYDAGQAELESALMNKIYQASSKNWVAALALGKVRFGWREGEQRDAGTRVNIVFSLPGAMQPAQYVEQLSNDDNNRDAASRPVAGTIIKRS